MVEVAKPDYLSLVNKGGSGFNISELVTSIVAAEIAVSYTHLTLPTICSV